MNPWQQLRQLRYAVKARSWAGGTAGKVFADCEIIAGAAGDEIEAFRMPMVLLSCGDTAFDDENPGIRDETYTATIVAQAEGQSSNTAALMGGPRSGGVGESEGRGLLELEEELIGSVGRLTGADGAPFAIHSATASAVARVTGGQRIIARAYTIRAMARTARYYAPPHFVSGSGGAGSITVTWDLPATRWDTLRPIVRYQSGATAPATATAGTSGGTLAIGATSAVIVVAAGTYSAAVFMSYDETGSATAERHSDQELGTTKASIVAT